MPILPLSLKIDGASAVTCESLALACRTLTAANAGIGTLVMDWLRCGSPMTVTGCPLARGQTVELVRDGTILFRGTVERLEARREVRGSPVTITCVDQFGAWKRRTFTRGAWWPSERYIYGYTPGGPLPARDFSNSNNSPLCFLFYGFYWDHVVSGSDEWDARNVRAQTPGQAIEELIEFANVHDERDSITTGTVTQGTLDFGTPAIVPETDPQGVSTALDWLVKILRPQLDGWASLTHGASETTLNAGRFRDVTATTLNAADIRRSAVDERAEEQALAVVAGISDTPGSWSTPIVPNAEEPSGAIWADVQALSIPLTDTPTGWLSGTFDLVAASAMRARPEGRITVDAQLWSLVQPGARVSVGGVTLNVQTATWDFASDSVSLSAGSPRQLGVTDLESLSSWLAKNYTYHAYF